GMWWFNEGSGNIAVDSSQYQNDGIINGPIWNSGVTHCYSITTSANPTNGGSTTGDGDYLSGTQVTVIATPNTGWIFQDWTENGNVVSTDSSYTFTVSSDRDLVANFESITYTITTISNPTNGGTTSGGGNYSYGTIITLTASPNSGFYFINWTENGNVVSTSPSFQYTVTGNSTLVANFNQQEPYTITTSSNPVQGGITSGGGNYLPGSQCTVIATPNLGYLFYSWTEYGNQVSTNPIYTFTVTGNRTLVANFYLEVGIEEINPIFNIFPNPTSGIVHIQSSEPIERLLIYNSFGVLVKNTESNQNDVIIDLKLNSKGVYFIKITVGSKVFSRKVVLLY
nr:T9SS type A sorting domain-containing protein [Bacteroidota bacterium]